MNTKFICLILYYYAKSRSILREITKVNVPMRDGDKILYGCPITGTVS